MSAAINYPVGHPKYGGRCGASIPGKQPRSAHDRAIPAGVCVLMAGHPGRHSRKDETMRLATTTTTTTKGTEPEMTLTADGMAREAMQDINPRINDYPTTDAPAAPTTTTLADLLAAAELGAIDPSTPVVPVASVQAEIDRAAAIARQAGHDAGVTEATRNAAATFGTGALPAGTVAVPANVHDCGMSGCAHGAMHGPDYVPQPDRQLKMTCPCGTVVRLTPRALQRAGSLTCGSGHTLTVDATRRTYGGSK